MPTDIETEICVIGAGPSGASTALRLAQLGRRVCLVERAAFPRQHVGESLPSSVWPILEVLGVAERVLQAGFLRAAGSILNWGGAFERRGADGNQPGLLVDRGQFDALLLKAALSAGVQVVQPARAYRPVRVESGWKIPVRSDMGTHQIRTQVLVDAAGRQAGLGRRFRPTSKPLLALYAYWQSPPGFGALTRVEAGSSHWYWGGSLPGGIVNAMVFVDPSVCTGLAPAARRDLYLNLLTQSTLLSPCLEQRRIGPVRHSDATSRSETTPPAFDFLRVGEAAFSVDALSSQGVQLAMAQAVQAAVVVNTLLMKPEYSDLALSFYADRQSERVQTHSALAADFYAQQQAVCPAPFWAERAEPVAWLPDLPRDHNPEELDGDQLLRLAPKARLAVSGVQTATLIEPRAVLMHPNLPRPVAVLDDVPLAPLLQRLGGWATADHITQQWSDTLDARRVARVLRWLWYHRVLVPVDEDDVIPVSSASRMA
ncbi:tryptophan halogenase [Ruegeria sp. ANG-R]|uniref:flavin-dependent monooxygenase QhpG n=1 Tax=Ruegeria sp. ANG-R TaxID=1577903 RepID=UPI00057FE2B3|nr:FAD-dependent oxidoreductase [Ruegeria sp. ANG-R]KIC41854.1 tryptophan halogenase [Ruegeria sp. ANG-R]